MKNKFQRLSKEEKKVAIKKYYETESGKENKARFKRLFIYSIICLVYGCFLIIEEIIQNMSFWNYVLGCILLIAGFIFLFGSHKIKVTRINDYLVKKKK